MDFYFQVPSAEGFMGGGAILQAEARGPSFSATHHDPYRNRIDDPKTYQYRSVSQLTAVKWNA